MHTLSPLLFSLLLLSATAVSANVMTLRTAAQSESEPKFIVDKHGKMRGICVDIFQAVERNDPGLKVSGYQQLLPLARIENHVRTGLLDMYCGLGISAARKQQFIFAQPPIYQVSYHLATVSGDTLEIQNWDDVRRLGKQGAILVNRNSGAAQRLKDMGGLIVDDSASSSLQNYRKLLAGRARFYYYRSPGFTLDLRKHGLSKQIRILPTVMESTPFYILFGQHCDEQRLQRFESALQKLRKSGELDKIIQRYS